MWNGKRAAEGKVIPEYEWTFLWSPNATWLTAKKCILFLKYMENNSRFIENRGNLLILGVFWIL